jgi:hypothetical protein
MAFFEMLVFGHDLSLPGCTESFCHTNCQRRVEYAAQWATKASKRKEDQLPRMRLITSHRKRLEKDQVGAFS